MVPARGVLYWAILFGAICITPLLAQVPTSPTREGTMDSTVPRVAFIPIPLSAPATTNAHVFYATNRQVSGTGHVAIDYSDSMSSNLLSFGACTVSIPRDHRMGALESPSIFRLQFRNDPQKHIILQEILPLGREEFFRQVRVRAQKSERKELLVFIHGFNVSFEDAVRRTAQLAYDLGLDGVPIAFTWPSHHLSGPADLLFSSLPESLPLLEPIMRTDYMAAEEDADRAAFALKELLNQLLLRSGATTINLISHGLGGRVLSRALHEIDAPEYNAKVMFREVMITAPDIDVELFKQLLVAFRFRAARITLYASSRDRILGFSRAIHGGHPRAGESGANVVIAPGLDTVDVSLVDTGLDGHSYYGDNRSVISDMFYLLRSGLPPKLRFGLYRMLAPLGEYWLFRP